MSFENYNEDVWNDPAGNGILATAFMTFKYVGSIPTKENLPTNAKEFDGWLTLDDGYINIFNKGKWNSMPWKGDDGNDAIGYNIKGSVTNQSNLPKGPKDRDAYVVENEGSLAIYVDDNWLFVPFVGPKGEPGRDSTVAGPKGEPGRDGRDAPDPINGVDGRDGKDGESIVGPKGEPGNDSTVAGPKGDNSIIPGPRGFPGKDSTVPGPPGKDSTVPGPAGRDGADSTVPGPKGVPGRDGKNGVGIPGGGNFGDLLMNAGENNVLPAIWTPLSEFGFAVGQYNGIKSDSWTGLASSIIVISGKVSDGMLLFDNGKMAVVTDVESHGATTFGNFVAKTFLSLQELNELTESLKNGKIEKMEKEIKDANTDIKELTNRVLALESK